MKDMEKYLFDEMTKAIENKHELELRLLIAEKECQALQAAYKAFIDNK